VELLLQPQPFSLAPQGSPITRGISPWPAPSPRLAPPRTPLEAMPRYDPDPPLSASPSAAAAARYATSWQREYHELESRGLLFDILIFYGYALDSTTH
jgi:hypothetical protein